MHDSKYGSRISLTRAGLSFVGALIIAGLTLLFSAGTGWAGSAKVMIGSGAHGGHHLRSVPRRQQRQHSMPRREHHRKHDFRQKSGSGKRGFKRRHRRRDRRAHHNSKARYYGTGYRRNGEQHCRHATENGHDVHGRPALIGMTICYDRRSRSYIVDGSRYVIHYF